MTKQWIAIALVAALGGCSKKNEESKSSSPTPSPSASTKEPDPASPAPAIVSDPASPDPATPPVAKPPVEIDMSKLKVTAKGWEGEFNKNLKDWVYEKYTPGKDGMNVRNSLTISTLPDDAPAAVDEYATKLGQKDFQDFGFKYTAIAAKTKLADGWLITGTSQGTSADDKPEPGFVVMREIGGAKIRCKSMTLTSEKIRTEAIELCKSIAQ